MSANASTEINIRFPGQYYDQETGTHYNFHRDYDPSTGRYLQSDPIGLRGGINTFVYAHANPKIYFDNRGLDVWVGAELSATATFFIGGDLGAGITKNTSTGESCIYITLCGRGGMDWGVGLGVSVPIEIAGPHCGKDLSGWSFSICGSIKPGVGEIGGCIDGDASSPTGVSLDIPPLSVGVGGGVALVACYAEPIYCWNTPCECKDTQECDC
ncbi:hypothetical protein CK621_15050 [Vandammella animalimorsus]|uniref:RHS repeat-associated core domain-containing protein n=1 Tax=Vandammella animalimorsus TaxID=2029117 RepID=A0A2A2AM88_9BURK|nr:hypothetical protein CK621_15050 [Vandammella animalimorsus]